MPRRNTNRLLEMVDEGLLDTKTMLLAALNALSDAEVHEMCQRNDVFLFEDEDEDYECFEDDRCGDAECPECGEDVEWDPAPSPASMGLSRDFKKNPLPRFDPNWKK